MPGKPEDWPAVLEAVRVGDRVALVKLTRLISGFLARYRAYEMRDAWDDLIQDVLTSLLRSAQRDGIREPRAFVSYVGTAVRNKLLDFVAKQKRPGAADLEGDPETADATSQIARQRRAERPVDVYLDLQRSLDALPEKLRVVVEAIYINGYSYEEASRRLGIPLGTLKRLQTQGLRELRSAMGVER